MLNINKNIDGNKACYQLEGRLDTVTSPDLEEALKENIESLEELVLDFGNLEYISSAGLRVLLAAHKIVSKNGQMKLTNVNSTIMEIFDVTGFSDILTIE
ncbi:MAG: STAS domain-containing protein [Clostridiales bacterium]|nr:STAS domain-containing protein [Clostridiales bacterium]